MNVSHAARLHGIPAQPLLFKWKKQNQEAALPPLLPEKMSFLLLGIISTLKQCPGFSTFWARDDGSRDPEKKPWSTVPGREMDSVRVLVAKRTGIARVTAPWACRVYAAKRSADWWDRRSNRRNDDADAEYCPAFPQYYQ